MTLDDILKKLNGVPEADKAEIVASAVEATKEMLWVPNPGPQTEAYFCLADELFYGGQAGGGKTDLALGLSLNEHERSLILRRTNKEAAGLVDRLIEMVGSSGVNRNLGIYRSPTALIETGGCELEDDKQKRKGIPHSLKCVGFGTPVLRGDGSYTPVQDMRVGMYVATLSGPRRVSRAFKTQKKRAVEVEVNGTRQVQSDAHMLLTPAGWASCVGAGSSNPSVAQCGPQIYSPAKVCRSPGICAAPPGRSAPQPSQSLRESTPGLPRMAAALRAILGRAHQRVRGVCVALGFQENDCAKSDDSHAAPQPLALSCAQLAQSAPCQRLASPKPCRHYTAHATYGAPDGSALEDCLGSCSAGCGLCGAPLQCPPGLLLVQEDDPALFQRSGDAAPPSPKNSLTGGRGCTRRCTAQIREYPHPYGRGTYPTNVSTILCYPYSVTPMERQELYDLEIEEVNHFITFGGIVNKNCFDEISDFTETQYTFIIGWNRSAKPGQRCRVLATGNPPTKPEGLWVLKRWGAWLDPQHPNPAKPGELRWYTTIDGADTEVDGPGPHIIPGEDKPVYARSRTFIPAELSDNPDLEATGYAATLAALPPELREAYRDGKFGIAMRDDGMQCIPSAWVHAANARWTTNPPPGVPMCAIGVDVAQGGDDRTVLAPRHDGWYAKLQVTKGSLTPDGKAVSGLVVASRYDMAKVIIDNGGGWGGDAYAHMAKNGIDIVGYMGVKSSNRRTQDNTLKFFNVRTEAYWRFREALDPSQPQGSTIALPPDKELEADLCAPRFEVKGHGVNGVIHLESKEKVMKRIGRSPDKGDAVVMAWTDGLKQVNVQGGWEQRQRDNRPTRATTKRG